MSSSRPVILVHSAMDADTARNNLGEPGYSRFFVLQSFLPMLQALGDVTLVTDPASEVDPVFFKCRDEQRHCLFLDFCKPDQLNLDLKCPTIPVFACESETIPNETWDSNIQNDWRYPLSRAGWAITHSSHTLRSVQQEVRFAFPIVAAPAPVWDRFAGQFSNRRGKNIDREFSLEAQDGYLIDSRAVDLIEFAPGNRSQANIPPPLSAPASLKLSGVVYTALLNPWDESKNWKDLIWTFCWALKERADATLVIKLSCPDADDFIETLLHDVYKMTPVSCRIVVVSGFLSDSSYESLAANTTYAVSSSRAEGQSMPLMEFMSCGAPAIAPCHTGLADYIDPTNAFITESSIEPTYWAEDPRQCYRTMWHRLSWESMVEAFRTSYQVVRDDPDVYEGMSRSACNTMKQHCSSEVVSAVLGDFFSDMFNSFKQYSNPAGPVPGRSGK